MIVGLRFVTRAYIKPEETAIGDIRVRECTTLDGVIDAPTRAAEYPFDPRIGIATLHSTKWLSLKTSGPRTRHQQLLPTCRLSPYAEQGSSLV